MQGERERPRTRRKIHSFILKIIKIVRKKSDLYEINDWIWMDVFRPEINAGVAADDDGKQIKNTEANHYSKQ